RASDGSAEAVVFIEFTTLLGGSAAMAAWFAVSTQFTHLDDVMVLAFACVAIDGVIRRNPWLLGLAIGLGVASKPWGIIMLPLVLVFPLREWWKPLAVTGAI